MSIRCLAYQHTREQKMPNGVQAHLRGDTVVSAAQSWMLICAGLPRWRAIWFMQCVGGEARSEAHGAHVMGHPPSDERLEFTNLEVGCGNGRFWHIWNHCDRAYETSKQPDGKFALCEPKQIKGRIETFKSHLKHCPHFKAYVKACASANALPGADSERSTSGGTHFYDDGVLS
ncbi:hypothetical protein PHYPSEUDO_010953 [Phytophthora pseudosyringae]|uniref:Uncharacterized protein n=1 Tax=Phytophthora pseudosyringae TaxID=221518 RepID=A0A8T1V9Y8_9STRA|nr:hypothetical protein PHYPSEUDO_010940 [Phytophthora pseudosyringae]KAG7377815.1 hypothetical protein PHYPSEUDO_010953 [Phytophthora pseudosyringae]